jgi:hypothetical protein
MTLQHKIRLLNKANQEFNLLAKKAKYKASLYKVIDIFIKIILSFGGALITYFSDTKDDKYITGIKAIGIVISSLTALSSIFMFEKRSLSNMQIYTKCQSIIPEIDDKIDSLRNREDNNENIQEYIRKIFKELSTLCIANFTDSVFEKLTSRRVLENE